MARGTIRLPGETGALPFRGSYGGIGESGIVATLASVPWFLVGVAGVTWEWVTSRFDEYALRSRRGYRNLPVDEDAQILRFEDEE